MPLAIRDSHDPVAPQPLAPDLAVRRETSAVVMAVLQGKTEADMERRFSAGHRAYVAWRQGQPAAWGWVATRHADIGELSSTFAVPEGERYLWNFVTLKEHRGLGIYPRLLDAIVRAESDEAQRFWIAYAPENHASGAGIFKAGFRAVAELSFDAEGKPAVLSRVAGGGAMASRVLGLPQVTESLSQCWRCARAGRPNMGCSADTCRCDYQRPESGCAA